MFSIIESQKIKQLVEHILHVPGNFTADILEMAIVLDRNIPSSRLRTTTADLIKLLKGHSVVFRNVRLNVIEWCSDSEITAAVVPMPVLQMGKYFDDSRESSAEAKHIEPLLEYLRTFQARSKLILVLTDGNVSISDENRTATLMRPFLERKTMFILENGLIDCDSVQADSNGVVSGLAPLHLRSIVDLRH